MPLSFSIPFGGSSIHISSFSSRRSGSPYPVYPSYPSTSSSTRFTTLASQSNALRNAAFARSNRGSNGSHRAGMFLLHLSMLSLLPLLFDSAHGQSAYGYGKRGMATMAVSEDVMQEELTEDYALSNKPIRSAKAPSTPQPLMETRTAARSQSENIVLLQKDLLAKLQPMLARCTSHQAESIADDHITNGQREAQLLEASQAIAIAQGIISLDLQLGRDPLASLTRQGVHNFVLHITSVLGRYHKQASQETDSEVSLSDVKEDFTRCLARLADHYTDERSHGLKHQTCKAIHSLGVEMGDIRMATMGWLLAQNARGAEMGDDSARPVIVREPRERQANHVTSNILGGLTPTADGEICDEKAYLDAVSAYTSVLAYFKQGKIRLSTKIVPVLDMMLLLPVPPPMPSLEESGVHKHFHELPAAHFSTPPLSIRDAIAQHHFLFRSTHAHLISLVEAIINCERLPEEGLEKLKLQFHQRTERWSLQSIPDEEYQQNACSGQSAEEENLFQQFTCDPKILQIVMEYCYMHLRCWEAGQFIWSRVALRAIRNKLNSISGLENRQLREVLRGDMQNIRSRIDATRIRATTLLQRSEQDTQIVVDQVLGSLALRLKLPPCPSIVVRPEQSGSLTDVAEQRRHESTRHWQEVRTRDWQIDLLLQDGVSNDLIVAMLSLWTATSKFQHIRLFLHKFLGVRGQSYYRRKMAARSARRAQFTPEDVSVAHHQDDAVSSEAADAQSMLTKWNSSPAIWTTLLNAACKYGSISLIEKIWLAACEEEEKRDWKLPLAAYTAVLQCYADEARRESIALARKEAFRDSTHSDSDSGTSEAQDLSGSVSRTTYYARAQLKKQGISPLSARFAWEVYRRLSDTQPDIIPDERFFNAALRVFRESSPVFLNKHRTHYAGRGLRKLKVRLRQGTQSPPFKAEDTPILAMVMRDVLNAGLPLPIMLGVNVQPARTGIFNCASSRTTRLAQPVNAQISQLNKWTSSSLAFDAHQLYALRERRDRR